MVRAAFIGGEPELHYLKLFPRHPTTSDSPASGYTDVEQRVGINGGKGAY